ncbi:HtaA domain-containing protein [Streptomyces sp. NRRL F-5065]|uniref:HtaA domain-containing protein n=1 Tax=Streptomyces sp. NRRL F-5065 TaxID=1463855 RepID=UPI0004BE8204|nr:HtaA domain-containing protein [Streptomyces sp. NRRL F-5065]
MPVRRRRSLTLAAAVTTAAALGATALATLGAGTASAAEVPLEDYELTWGIKQSYRAYVATFAKGGFTAADGASQAADNGVFTFTGGVGGYDATGHTVNLAFQGSLAVESAAHGFAFTLSDVKFDSKDARITADVTANGTTRDDVPLATVEVTRDMRNMETTLTGQAAEVFGSASYEGAAGDPLTVVRNTPPTPTTPPASEPPAQSPEPTDTPGTPEPTASETTPTTPPTTGGPSPTASEGTAPPKPSAPATRAPAQGALADGTLGWGVKDSFRAYVTGPTAKGTITTSGGATQAAANGAFTFKDATGTYDTKAGKLDASFKGAVSFKGHETNGSHGLDLTLSNLRATLDGGRGTLTADVNSLGEKSAGVVLADLEAQSAALTAKDDVITVDAIAATLTAAGATAFGDFYTAGTALDPVTLSVALTDGAKLPEGGSGGGAGGTGGSGGGGTSGGAGSTVGGVGSTTGGITGGGSLAATGAEIPGAALGAAAGLAVAAGAGAVLVARKRRPAAE